MKALIAALVGSVSLALLGVAVAQPPVYNGKPLTQWLKDAEDKDASLRWQAVEALGKLAYAQPRTVLPALIRAAEDEDLDIRLQAVVVLRSLDNDSDRAVGALARLLADKDSELRRSAAEALANLGPNAEPASSHLGRLLEDPSSSVRLAGVKALHAIGAAAGPATVQPLTQRLKDKVPAVRRAAASALAGMASELDPDRAKVAVLALAGALKDNDPQARQLALRALGNYGPRAQPALTAIAAILRGPDVSLRFSAASALGRLGEAGVPELLHSYRVGDAQVQYAAVQGLSESRSRNATVVKILHGAMNAKEAGLRQLAAAILVQRFWNRAELRSIVLAALKSPHPEVRAAAVPGLSNLAGSEPQLDDALVEVFAKALKDDSAEVRRRASAVLAQVGAPARPLLKNLQALAEDKDTSVSESAARALVAIDPASARAAVPLLLKQLRVERGKYSGEAFNPDAARALAAIGAVDLLVEALQGSDEVASQAALFALKTMRPLQAKEFLELTTGLTSKEPAVRQRTALLLSALSTPRDQSLTPVVTKFLTVEDRNARAWAVVALGRLCQTFFREENVAQLCTAAGDREPTIRSSALAQLRSLAAQHAFNVTDVFATKVVPVLVERLKDEENAVRQAAVEVVGELARRRGTLLGLETTIEPLLALLPQGTPYNTRAATVLAQIGKVEPVLAAMTGSSHEKIRAGASQALREMGRGALPALPVLLKSFADKDCYVRIETARTLAALGREAVEAVPVLAQALEDDDLVVPPEAAHALASIGPAAEAAIPALLKAMTSPRPNLVAAAEGALVAIGPKVVPAAAELLQSERVDQALRGASILRQLGSKAQPAIPALVKAFARPEAALRQPVAEALMSAGATGPQALPAALLVLRRSSGDRLLGQALAVVMDVGELTPAEAVPLASAQARFSGPEAPVMRRRALGLLEKIGVLNEEVAELLTQGVMTPGVANLIERLARKQGGDMVPLLTRLGLGEVQIVRVLAASPQNVPILAEQCLKHPTAQVRAAAAQALGGIKPLTGEQRKAVLATLRQAHQDTQRQVRLAALDGLVKLREAGEFPVEQALTPDILGHWDTATQLRGVQLLALSPAVVRAELSPKVLPLLVAALRHGDYQAQKLALGFLVPNATPGVPEALKQLLQDEDTAGRQAAIRLLGKVREWQLFTPEAARQLAPEAGLLLLASLKDSEPGIRQQALHALVELGEKVPKLEEALQRAVRDREEYVRRAAAVALWKLAENAQDSLPVLIGALRDLPISDPRLLDQAKAGTTGYPALECLLEMADRLEKGDRDHLAKVVQEALHNDHPNVRGGALVVLGARPELRTLDLRPEKFIRGEPSAEVRMQLLLAAREPRLLIWLRTGPELQFLLREALFDPDPRVVQAALQTIGKAEARELRSMPWFKEEDRLPTLLGRLLERAPAPAERAALLEALLLVEEKAERKIQFAGRALKDGARPVRSQAVALLAKQGNPGAVRLAETLRDSDPWLRLDCAVALGKLPKVSDPVRQALQAAAKDTDPEVRAAVTAALKQLP